MTRALTRAEIELIWTIDRSEVHHHVYKVAGDELVRVPAYFEIPGWQPKMIEADRPKLYDCFDRGGVFLGEFDGDALVGIAVVDTKPCGSARDQLQLLYLYVSRSVRGQGVGGKLFGEAASSARALGARALYISAVPTENTVDFYLGRGAALARNPDPDLIAAEPDDIHLTYPLRPVAGVPGCHSEGMTTLVAAGPRIGVRAVQPAERAATKQAERERKGLGRVQDRFSAVSESAAGWVERQEPDSSTGVAISAWRHYRAIEGPLQSALLSLYMLVAVLPALLVLEEYLDPHPNALAHRIVHHYHLNAPTASLLTSVLSEGHAHKLGSALLAIASALFFGLSFGRVLQLVYARSWNVALPKRQTDFGLYALVLLSMLGLIVLLLVQLTELRGAPRWTGYALDVGWIALLVLFFVWAPRLLTHKLITPRDLLPGAALTALGLVLLMVVSTHVMQFWVDLYARDYGGFGVVLAVYFWIAFSSAVIVAAASLSPALADRRNLRQSSAADSRRA